MPTMYPIISSGVTLSCTKAPVLVYTMASLEHYGILIPLDGLPEIIPHPEYENPLDNFFDELAQYFWTLVQGYIEDTKSQGLNFSIPETPDGMITLSGKTCSLEGSLEVKTATDNCYYALDLTGDHLLITEKGVEIEEFCGQENPSRILH